MGRVRKESQSPTPAILVPSLLNECQKSQACHTRAIRQLVECRKNHWDDFMEVWIRCLQPMFLISKREPAVERIVNFAASFTAYWDEELYKECEKFFESFLSILLRWAQAAHKTVRFRACQMISEAVSKLDASMEVNEDLWDQMTSTLLTRMEDKQTSVRVFAANALSRLVIADDIDNDLTVQAYRKALASDTSAEVRKMVVKSMPADNATISDVVERIADVSEAVRKASYQTIGEKLFASGLSITQRAMTIERGLAERVPAVRTECEKLLELWLSKDCDGDPLILLRHLDVETYEKAGELAMLELLSKNLIKFSGTGLRKFLDASGNDQVRMNAEEALFWRVVCMHIHSEAKAKGSEAANTGGAEAAVNAALANEKNEYLESILPPTVSDFVQLVENHLHKGSVAWFAARQMLLIATLMDFTDSTSRKDAGLLLQRLLRETAPSEEQSYLADFSSQEWVGDGLSLGGEESWANAVAEFARHVHASSGEFEEVIAAAVADVGRPCREGGADERQWLHCLAVTGLLLENITSLDVLGGRAIEPEEIVHSLLLPAVKHLHPEVQRAGVRCLAIFCGLERSPSRRAVDQLRLCLQSARPQVQKMALKGMFDLILCHGAAAIDRAATVVPDLGLPTPHPRPPGIHIPDFTATEVPQMERSEGRRLRLPLLTILKECLHGEVFVEDSEDQTDYINQIVGVAAEGFAKVLLRNKRFEDVRSIQEDIAKDLLMLYFSDTTTHSPRLKQCLAVFFQIWCSLSAANKEVQIQSQEPSLMLHQKYIFLRYGSETARSKLLPPLVDALVQTGDNLVVERCISAVFIPVVSTKWPGIYATPGKPGTVVVARKHAAQVAHFMLHLLHTPLILKANQGTNQTTPSGADGATLHDDHISPGPECGDAVNEGLETLAIRICVEVKEQTRKFTSLSMARKTYTAMLFRVINLLRFSPAQQEKIKGLSGVISLMIQWLPPSEKRLLKALTEALARVKELDETPENGLTDEELELFMVRMGFHDFFKEDSSPDPSTPEPQSVCRTGGRRVSGASRRSAGFQARTPASTRSAGVQRGVTNNTTRKNLSAVYESTDDESESSTISSDSDSDLE